VAAVPIRLQMGRVEVVAVNVNNPFKLTVD